MNTQINVYIVLYILFLHFLADFIFQTDKMAKGKSKNWGDLLNHTITYSCMLWLGLGIVEFIRLIYNNNPTDINYLPMYFGLITFVFHTAQDYITSRINSKLWEQKKVHMFFVSIGFDQLLHFIQLILTYQLLS